MMNGRWCDLESFMQLMETQIMTDQYTDYRALIEAAYVMGLLEVWSFQCGTVILNPHLEFIGDEQMELLDDCMSFPKLLVRVRRYRHCILRYLDENWVEQKMRMDDDMSELIQHEYDYLDGILATMRAIDNKSFVMKKQKEN